jgi:hypothetical protein
MGIRAVLPGDVIRRRPDLELGPGAALLPVDGHRVLHPASRSQKPVKLQLVLLEILLLGVQYLAPGAVSYELLEVVSLCSIREERAKRPGRS